MRAAQFVVGGCLALMALMAACEGSWQPRPKLGIDSVHVLPEAPFNDGLLSCVVVVQAPDDADLVVRWEVEGRRLAVGPELDLDLHKVAPSATVTCRALLTRGHERADASAGVQIANRQPQLHGVEVVPAEARVGDEVVCVVDASDPDDDALATHIAWSPGSEGSAYVVQPGDRQRGPLRCEVEVRDPSGAVARGAAEAAVLNSPPDAPGLRILPAAPRRGDALRCEVAVPSYDPDAEPVHYDFRWFVDGASTAVGAAGAAVSVVPGHAVQSGQGWRCEVRASDGLDDAPLATAEVRTPPEAGDVDTSSVLGTLSYLPSGTFTMGCLTGRDDVEEQPCDFTQPPAREVTLTTPLWVMQTEVTQAHWLSVFGANPAFAQACGGDCPVERVTWWAALAFANEVSDLENLPPCYILDGCDAGPVAQRTCDGALVASPSGLLKHCRGYRLPSDAEWEHAARYDESLPFAGSAEVGGVARYAGNSGMRAWHACSLAANSLGLCDMSGNVSEWVWDVFSASVSSGPVTDPMGPLGSGFRVRRGGYWGNAARFVQAHTRAGANPDLGSSAVGFRLVRSAP